MDQKNKWHAPGFSTGDYTGKDSLDGKNDTRFDISSANLLAAQQVKIYRLEDQVELQGRRIKEYSSMVAKSSDKIVAMERDLATTIESTQDKISDLRRGVTETRNKTMEPLAIFVGLFTFASISFQIFSSVRDFEIWVALLVVIAGVLTIFSGLVVHATSISLDVDKRRKVTIWIIVMGLVLTMVGSYLYTIGNKSVSLKYSSECVELIENKDENPQAYCRIP